MLTLLLAIVISATPASTSNTCDRASQGSGAACSFGGSAGSGGVDLEGRSSGNGSGHPDTDAGAGSGRTGSGTNGTGSGGNGDPDVPGVAPKESRQTVFRDYFGATTRTEETDPPITLTDIAHFRTETGKHGMEPNGWALTNLETNFFSTAQPHTITGEILGLPAEVRFTPTAWHWNYGDGTQATTTTGGAPWNTLRAREFDKTATSHIFRTKEQLTVTLTIDFTAEYRINSQWNPITGTITTTPPPLTVTVTSVRTVLVNNDCNTKTTNNPGC